MSKIEETGSVHIPTTPAVTSPELVARVKTAKKAAIEALLQWQRPDGYWLGELEGDSILESEYILLRRILDDWGDDERLTKAARCIRNLQQEDGSWALYPGGPGDISPTIKSYFALKLCGDDPNEPHMARARGAIARMGGVAKANTYTKIYLALLGQISWWAAPAIPPEIMLFPRWFYFNLYEFSSWTRTIIVPLMLVWSKRPVTRIPESQGIRELLVRQHWRPFQGWDRRLVSWRNFFLAADRMLKLTDMLHITPFRKRALRVAEKWMLEHVKDTDGLGAIYPPMVSILFAFRCLGYPDDHPEVVRARAELEHLAIEEDDTLRFQPCVSPVWDTAIACIALHEAGLSAEHPAIQNAARWLISKEVRKPGDWSLKDPDVEPGGWYFEFANEFYPDIDDTAMVLMALKRAAAQPGGPEAILRGIAWILAMQSRNGGWASFDRDNDRMIFTHIPFADHNAMLDPPTSDITGRILEMLGFFGYTPEHPRVRRAIEFLKSEQEEDGSWYGRWGVNYIYGTWQVLRGLRGIGEDPDQEYIQRAASWIRCCQNPDGGWGESCQSYDEPRFKGTGPSTASQTAWALMGLFAAGDTDSVAVRGGIEYLISAQTADGTWEETHFTGAGFPKVFYLRYHLYRHSFPLLALGEYWRLMGESAQ